MLCPSNYAVEGSEREKTVHACDVSNLQGDNSGHESSQDTSHRSHSLDTSAGEAHHSGVASLGTSSGRRSGTSLDLTIGDLRRGCGGVTC